MSEATDSKWDQLSALLDEALALTSEIEADGPTPNSVSGLHGEVDSKLDQLKSFMDKYTRVPLPPGHSYQWTRVRTGLGL